MLRDTAKLSPMAAIGRGLAAGSKSADAVTGNGSLDVMRYGRLLKARQLVGVRGAGMAFDGLYFVESVTTHDQARRVQTKFHPHAQRPHLHHSESSRMSDQKYFGKYRGMVINNIDPMQMGRLMVQVPDISRLMPFHAGRCPVFPSLANRWASAFCR